MVNYMKSLFESFEQTFFSAFLITYAFATKQYNHG